MGSEQSFACNECLERLLKLKAPSRLQARDASLFDASPEAAEYAAGFLGWVDLSSRPPFSVTELAEIASGIRLEGLDAVVLLGQGGSSQAAMTITKLHEVHTDRTDVNFYTIDSLSPEFVTNILKKCDPARTLYIVSSKSGSTIEPLMLERVVWSYVVGHLGIEGAAKRFVAITDPESSLEQLAHEKNYRLVLPGPSGVGGRFSALSVFGLFPAALVGIDIEQAVASAAAVEARCAADTRENPALSLASFLYRGLMDKRDKVSLVMPPSGLVFGLWIEQLVAESLGKQGKGIVPNIEIDPSTLREPRADRCVITYEVGHTEGFSESLTCINECMSIRHFTLQSIEELLGHFVIWEYAIAFLGILMKLNPFDQPDVDATKLRVSELLREDSGMSSQPDHYSQVYYEGYYVPILRMSAALINEGDLLSQDESVGHELIDSALRTLLGSFREGDYFSLNAFLPFLGQRRNDLETMRHRVASSLGMASCLEIGPRYLHSTGQLHKGGSNTGVFLFISADEDITKDTSIPHERYTLGTLAATQARADFEELSVRGRRAMQIHLCNSDHETLKRFADRFCSAVSSVKVI
ncbi:MAG: hypothetical protein LBD25_04760 [Coriobacteriales bacterium]|jgi:glucose-6-phosphate isomerase|nr:hypothetical protein [Coriobacteriales bacterium]